MTSFVWIGPLVGLFSGYFLAGGGPLGVVGSLLGGWLGHQFDIIIQLSSSLYQFAQPKPSARDSATQQAFFQATFVALGKIAKCDGAVCDAEIQWTTAVMERMGLSPERKRNAIELFDQGKSSQDISAELLELRNTCGRQPTLLQIFMEILVQGALADGKLDQKEWAALSHIAQSIRFRLSTLEKIVRSAQAHQEFRQSGSEPLSPQDELARAYEILAVNPDAGASELKRAYRRLMSKHHPDKLMSKGMPKDMLEIAKEKTQAIRSAYELIVSVRKQQ
ncbi:co-chaperone DjlA [Ketobacter sp. MCCC 1A13808]|uniref:co-chaperone DjlA n=1 Tax=Ketobacter sp. MCCC 1A13808 TaxID=2602738 RepID=UPI000F2417A0|nr:co-chaperone DjlA [Ketobacter sp. MCCC 1A13808]MVF13091.1 co-chaperone DjlA [Ketobacter sp. MCCC 1A13808]RLP53000.1 MAG: co-chaperone DjlA [Ketobacter sp.]